MNGLEEVITSSEKTVEIDNSRKKLVSRELLAMKRSIGIGRELQNEHPEIAQLYREGKFDWEIVKAFGIQSNYGVSLQIARSAVMRAITGNQGSSLHPAYTGLISDQDEIAALRKEHITRKLNILYEEHRGIHKDPTDKMRSARKENGKKYGPLSLQRKVGVHSRSSEQMRIDSLKGVVELGYIPWSSEEIDRLFALRNDPQYRSGTLSNISAIAKTLNIEYHGAKTVRVGSNVYDAIKRYSKKYYDK